MINSRLVLQEDALGLVAKEFTQQFPNKKPLLFADGNTWAVAGKQVSMQFKGCKYFLFDDEDVYADDIHVSLVQKQLQEDKDTIAVAVGSGTINDLCKRASFLCNRPYMCVATAPSVDGFTSNGAAITDHGFKVTLSCPAPVLVVADPLILSNAPLDMISSGYGDLAAKVTAGADWLIADTLGIEKIVPKVWDLVQPQLRDELSQPKALRNRERDAIAKVFDGLIHTGFAMQEYFDSRPASGADHLMSHVWEMNECCMIEGKAVSHGFKVAIGTLASTALMEELLTMDKALVLLAIENAKPLSWEERKAEIRSYVSSSSIQDRQIEICKKKFLEGPALVERKKMIVEHWDELKEKVGTQIIPFAELRERFSLAGCPVEPVTIALSYEDFRYGMRVAQMMRNRYTILDLVYELGLMDYMIEKISDPKAGYFHEYRNR